MDQEGRILKFEIFRYNPQKKNDTPRMKTYEVAEAPGMTIFYCIKPDPGATGFPPYNLILSAGPGCAVPAAW